MYTLKRENSMIPNMLCGGCKSHHHQRNLKMNLKSLEPMSNLRFQYSSPFDMDPDNIFNGGVMLKPNKSHNKNGRGIRKNMANKISNFSDLIHRVTTSCLLQPLGSTTNFSDDISEHHSGDDDFEEQDTFNYTGEGNEEEDYRTKREMEMVMLIGQVFETVSFMKTAYVRLQEAHSPWDADKIRLSDMAVVAELRKLAVLKESFWRSVGGGMDAVIKNRTVTAAMLREVVAPYETAMEKLKKEVKTKTAEVNNLTEKLKTAVNKSKSHSHQSKRRVSCSSQFQNPLPSPATPSTKAVSELFEGCFHPVKEGSRSFASLLLSLMKSAHWDITATVNSITNSAIIEPNHAKYALESYISRKIFQGFDHETFHMTGNISSHLNPNQFRSDCFTQFSDIKSMDPMELLGILPTCEFGKFCSNKYLSLVHPKMEESLFGDLEQRRQVLAGNHPRSRFYGVFLALAKAVWMLHLVAFSLDPLPSHFEGSRGADFHPEYMESAVRFPGERVGDGLVVGFPVSPGFKLGNGYIVKARVYLVPKSL